MLTYSKKDFLKIIEEDFLKNCAKGGEEYLKKTISTAQNEVLYDIYSKGKTNPVFAFKIRNSEVDNVRNEIHYERYLNRLKEFDYQGLCRIVKNAELIFAEGSPYNRYDFCQSEAIICLSQIETSTLEEFIATAKRQKEEPLAILQFLLNKSLDAKQKAAYSFKESIDATLSLSKSLNISLCGAAVAYDATYEFENNSERFVKAIAKLYSTSEKISHSMTSRFRSKQNCWFKFDNAWLDELGRLECKAEEFRDSSYYGYSYRPIYEKIVLKHLLEKYSEHSLLVAKDNNKLSRMFLIAKNEEHNVSSFSEEQKIKYLIALNWYVPFNHNWISNEEQRLARKYVLEGDEKHE